MIALRPTSILAPVASLILTFGIAGAATAQDATPAASADPVASVEPAASTGPAASADSTATVIASPIGDPRPAPELAGLINSDGSPFVLDDYLGSNVLIYFGYTHCPDVCPQTIGELFGVWEEQPDMQALFITVDPERDTPEFLEEWTRYLPENLHAVTGTPDAIRRAADAYDVRFARVDSDSSAGYTMAHTALLYLIDEHGQLLLSYPFGTPATEIAADIAVLEAE